MELLNGTNRYKEEYLVINRGFGIRSFNSNEVRGTSRLKLNVEAVQFWKWSYLGFKFSNYYFADAAFLSSGFTKLFNEKFYSGIGVGLRIHNESLVFNVLELRLTWFPIMPDHSNPFVFNAFSQPKTKFDDFLGRKPQEIIYQ